MNERKPSFAERLRSGEGAVSWINEPIDFTVNFAVEPLSALAIARQRWRCEPELISGEDHERERI